MKKKFKPRYYQIEAVEAALTCIWFEPKENPVIVMPTGTGKAPVIGWLCKAILMRLPHVRLMVSTHSKELVQQDAEELQEVWPDAPFGIYSAGLNSKQSSMPITICSVQSAVKNPASFGKIAILIIDECDMLSPAEESNYQKLITELKKKNPHLIVVGLTATPFRQKQGLIITDGIFTKFCYDISGREAFVRLIDEGFLVPLIPKKTSFEFDVTKIPKVGGDFNLGVLQTTVNKEALTIKALQEALQVAADRMHILVFCAGIDHVESVANILQAWGEDVVFVHSKMSDGMRDTNLARFKSGRARWMVNDGILTTGFNYKALDCIVLLRPTASPRLHVQILGRGTRPDYADGFDIDEIEGRLAAIEASLKQNCLVLDFAGNTWRLGPINDPTIPKTKGKGTGEVPVKLCPKCGTYQHAAVRFCDGLNYDNTRCDHEFLFETKLEQTAATVQLIARDSPECYWFKVDKVEYEPFTKPFSPPMMRVKYFSGMMRYSELICIEHQSYAGKVARDWWRKRLPMYDPPLSTYDGMALVDKLVEPTHVYVQVNTKHPKVLTASFDGTTNVFVPKGPTLNG